MKKFCQLIAASLIVVSAPSMAVTIESFDLGYLDVPSLSLFSNGFSAPGSYQDNYSFVIGESASASALVLELDSWWNKLDMSITAVALTGAGAFAGPVVNVGVYNFGTLVAGSYTLSIFSLVTRDFGLLAGDVGYAGLISLEGTSKSVPEPGTLGLLGLSLIGVAFAARRRKQVA